MRGAPLARTSLAAFLAMVSATMVPYAVAILTPDLIDEFELTATDIGLFGSVALLSAAVHAAAAGTLADRLREESMVRMLHLLYGGSVLVIATARSYGMILVGAVIAGMSLGLTNPATNRLITAKVATERWGLVTGIKQSGGQLSNVVAGLTLPVLILAAGWRVALLALAVIVPVGLLSTLRLPVPSNVPAPTEAGAADPEQVPTGSDAADRRLRRLRIVGLIAGSANGSVMYFLPLFVVVEFDTSVAVAGSITAAGAAAATASRFALGPVAARFADPTRPLAAILWLAVAAIVLLMLSPAVGLWLGWVASVLLGISALSFITPAMLAIMRLSPGRSTGLESGRFMRAVYTGGVVSPPIFGQLVDRFTDFRLGWTFSLILVAAAATLTTWPGRTSGPRGPSLA